MFSKRGLNLFSRLSYITGTIQQSSTAASPVTNVAKIVEAMDEAGVKEPKPLYLDVQATSPM
uniref:Uncharacterized protein n=1 Tax=Acrobeloides nanus TaxID=290746 RepID=A0A914D6P2_9BILA